MSIYSFLAMAAAILYAGAAFHSVRLQRHALANRLFAITCLLFSVWAMSFAFLQCTGSQEWAWVWYRVGAVGWTIGPALLLHFLLVLSDYYRFVRNRWLTALVYAPALVFLARAWLSAVTVRTLCREAGGWMEIPVWNAWSLAYTAYYLLYTGAGMIAVHVWGQRGAIATRRMQARVVVGTGVAAIALATLTNRILPSLHIHAVPPLASVVVGIWVAGIWYAVSRHGLLLITPGTAAEHILATMSDAVLLIGSDNLVVRVNPAALKLFGAEEKSLVGAHIKDILPFDDVTASQVIAKVRLTDGHLRKEGWVQSSSGQRIPVDIATATVYDKTGRDLGVVAILRDMSERRRNEDQLKHLANHDALTNLPNRLLLHDRLAQALARSRRHRNPVGVLVLDLDHFKEVNDTLGHDYGDALLQGVAQRLMRCVRECDTVARLGGDEFVVVVGELVDAENVEVVARRILAAFGKPFNAKEREIHTMPSIGISVFPRDADSADELLRLADVAMYISKSKGRGTYTVFERTMLRTVERRQSVESQLRQAVEKGSFSLRYLPFYDLRTGTVAGVEALVRWEHPALGEVSPGEFMPVAEGAGLMPEIDRWALRTACGHLAAWRAEGTASGLFVAVNVSARQIVDPGFPELLKGALAGAGLSPQDLQVEVAETVLAQGGANVDAALRNIKAAGVRVALDDYGAGYSWLTRLSGLAIDMLKVDRSLIQGITTDPRIKVIVQALVAVGRSMGKQVVAEGVETREQVETLKDLKGCADMQLVCDLAQGFLFSKPVPPEQVPALLAKPAEAIAGSAARG